MITRRRDDGDSDTRPTRVRVRLHNANPEQPRAAATAAGLDNSALFVAWLRACWRGRHRA